MGARGPAVNPHLFTVSMTSVGRCGIPRAHVYTVEATDADNAIRAAWDQAEDELAGLECIVTGPESVNGVECDPETNWNAVRWEDA